jgi:predicted ATPase
MILELTLENFKSFSGPFPALYREGKVLQGLRGWAPAGNTVSFGGLSLIIGTNASGKSNIRDGLRFIHGISRGYSLGEIIGEKYVEGGVLQWKGIRGGVRETVTRNGGSNKTEFTLIIRTRLGDDDGGDRATYTITVNVGDRAQPPSVVNEMLKLSKKGRASFKTKGPVGVGQVEVHINRPTAKKALGPAIRLRSDRPALTQLPEHSECFKDVRKECRAFLRTISSMRFLDLDPSSLRRPSIPGQTVLGDTGENLSSVLQAICADPVVKETLMEWTRELTPLDVVDMRFPEVSLEGRVQLQLIENGGREISAESASDGTLRFLAFAAAVLGTEPSRFYFFEEIENGIYPNRAHLLVNLLRKVTREGNVQVVGTTHSPALLSFLDEATLADASLVYRVGPVSRVRRLKDIPALWEMPPGSRIAGELLASGWFENAAAFLEEKDDK